MTTQCALPDLHVRPRRGWLNDPNGLTRYAGRWHVFFQHNPDAAVHDRIHWGHVSSTDLTHWSQHRPAFGPQPGGPDRFGCWSGVFVPGLDRPAVVYSGVVDETLHSTVCLRWGLDDDLDTWTDPIVVATTPLDAGVKVMRDPFVFTLGGARWALLGAGMDDGTPAALLYSCDDILNWNHVGTLLDHRDEVARREAPADIWECPQLLEVDGVAVLVLALQSQGHLDTAVALTGRLDLVDGRPSLSVDHGFRLDAGPLFYAPQCVVDDDGPLLFGWLRQEDVPGRPDDELVAGCLTLPRRIVRRGDTVTTVLDAALARLTGTGEPVHGLIELPRIARVEVSPPWRLSGTRVSLASSGPGRPDLGAAQIWVDGEIVEIYPADGSAPYATRDEGTCAWRLDCADATVTRIG